ncbi:uncharacterized protein BP01DRAFT_80562 [Aspergillus saccharolyticus JOP 1030-1]|uniref:Uncharacterized protein n=1 Tax=Aspergillus saccharolyticus JOP 1030-1 TaxID=1450539 RepID=A0A318ZDG9_9EURO|nr:hypothetical protein BP01DRAFT_80562 [Aspergillus saccharolyticus JOP 1030-1]PYH44344.1 hypothetical protein BP01DRAFT_80562 [Aspergillus saccharolyticus JOP 1030-1]
MHCQQRYYAFLHALLGVISNTTHDSPPLVPHQSIVANRPLSGCRNANAGISSYVTVSESNQAEELGCTILLGYPVHFATAVLRKDAKDSVPLNNGVEPGLKLTLSMTNIERGALDLQRCEAFLEELIFGELDNPLSASTPPDRSLSSLPVGEHRKRSNFTDEASGPRQAQDELPAYTAAKTPTKSDPKSLGYHGILEYLLGKEKGTKISQRAVDESDVVAMIRIGDTDPTIYRKSSKSSPDCADLCDSHGWRDTFEKKVFLDSVKGQCVRRRSETDIDRVERRHHSRKTRELDVFYKICAVFGASVIVATLLYVLREIYRRLRVRYSLLQGMRHRDKSTRGIAMKAGQLVPSDDMRDPVPEASLKRPSQTLDVVSDGFTTPSMISSATQQRYRRLTPAQRNTHRNIQEVFTLDSSQVRIGDWKAEERIPVLPPAPNASVRRHTGIWQAQKRQRCAENKELEGIGHDKSSQS